MSKRGKGTISFGRAIDCLITRKLYIGESKKRYKNSVKSYEFLCSTDNSDY